MAFWSGIDTLGGVAGPKIQSRFLVYFGDMKPYIVKKIDRPKLGMDPQVVKTLSGHLGLDAVSLKAQPPPEVSLTFADPGGEDDISAYLYNMLKAARNPFTLSQGGSSVLNYKALSAIKPQIKVDTLASAIPVSPRRTVAETRAVALKGGGTAEKPRPAAQVIEHVTYWDPIFTGFDFGTFDYEQDALVEVTVKFIPAWFTIWVPGLKTLGPNDAENDIAAPKDPPISEMKKKAMEARKKASGGFTGSTVTGARAGLGLGTGDSDFIDYGDF